MQLIERYLFRQLMVPTLAVTAALSGVAVLAESLETLNIIVRDRQSTLTFLKIIALNMPPLLSLVLPIALFIAALIAVNRLHTEQEIVVCYAGGMSRWRVTSPAFRVAILAVLVTLAINLWIAPWAQQTVRAEIFRVRTDLAASLVRDGEFTNPAIGLTVYAQSMNAEGQLQNIFIDQAKAEGGSSTFTAKSGAIVKRDGQPALLMRDGSNQQFNKAGVLNFLAFDEYVFDLAPYLDSDALLTYKVSDRYPHELAFPDLTQAWEQQNRKKLLAELHFRLSAPLYNLTFVALALAGVLGGSFSRLGYARRIAIVSGIALVVRIVGFGVQAACNGSVWLNVLQYLMPIVPAWLAARQLYGLGGSALGGLRTLGGGSSSGGGLQPLGASS